NVPVVKGIAPPAELFEIDRAKVVGLTIDPDRLAEIRRARVRAMGAPGRNRQYAELAEIYEELEQAKKLHRRLRCPVIDISELSQLGVPVPAGFTITTDACRAYMASGGEVAGLDEEIGHYLARLEEQTGRRFGDAEDPLLVSVRSGAAISMPGMMDTILNVGLNDASVAGLARSTGNEEFARDCYRRLIQMFGETVDDIPHE